MLKYLVVLLDRSAVSYCHYRNAATLREPMAAETLKKAIFFSMKNNLNIQFVYPDYELSREHRALIDTIDHADIRPASMADDTTDVAIFDGWEGIESYQSGPSTACIIRSSKAALFAKGASILPKLVSRVPRVNVVITDIPAFTEEDSETYATLLQTLSDEVYKLYVAEKTPQINILTDRMFLTAMNNCNAGVESICVAPDGRLYVCPEDYYSGSGESVGDLENGLGIPNARLYRLDNAPICRICDAYQCKRCVALNRQTTLEVNTPSRQQCVVAHIEREAARKLMDRLRAAIDFLPGHEPIKPLTYQDPFEIAKR